MNKLPRKYSKEEFVELLNEDGVIFNNLVKLKMLPETIKIDNIQYDLNIIASENSFEINYFSPEAMSFLFNYELFTNIDKCLQYIEKELKENGVNLSKN